MPEAARIAPSRPGRACGACSACCEHMGVEELKKPSRVACRHQAEGGGCEIYPLRPPSCQTFRCLWLDGLGPDRARPDLSGFIAYGIDEDGVRLLQINPCGESVDVVAMLATVVQLGYDAKRAGFAAIRMDERLKPLIEGRSEEDGGPSRDVRWVPPEEP